AGGRDHVLCSCGDILCRHAEHQRRSQYPYYGIVSAIAVHRTGRPGRRSGAERAVVALPAPMITDGVLAFETVPNIGLVTAE
ncbi:MAG: hypothetical protein ACREX8_05045, partial [Gammaproteobacteria bacterium]